MTGFRPPRAPMKLNFSGTEYEGLQITVRAAPMSVMLDVAAAAATPTAEGVRQVTAALGWALESWNVVDDDNQPVPADGDGLMSQDSRFVTAVITAWSTALAGPQP